MVIAEKREIPLAEVEAGMRLAEDLLGAQGQVLMRAGCELSEKQLSALSQRGVELVRVFWQPSLTEEERAEQIALIEQRIQAQFARFQGRPLMDELAELLRRHHLQGIR